LIKKAINPKKMLLILSLCISCITVSPLLVSAYELMGPKWASIYTDPLQYYSTCHYSTQVSSATSDWNNAVDDITLSSGGILCIYKIKDTNNSEVEWDGITDWAAVGGYFVKCDVYINEYPIEELSYPTAAIKSVIAHEMGHAFGLDENEGPYIMNPCTYGASSRYGYYGISTPQADDANGVDAIY